MAHNKRLALFIILFSSLVTLACSATTFESFMCTLRGGEWVKDLDDPLTYEYYCIENEYSPNPSDDEEPLPEDTTQLNNNGDFDVFIGTTTLPDLWKGSYSSNRTFDNSIVIRIDPGGTVTGTLTFNWQGGPSSPLEWEESPGSALHSCTTETVVSITGTLSGTLSDTNHKVQIELIQMQDIKRFDCPGSDEVFEGTDIRDVEISVDGDSLTGSVPGFFSFDATRQ